MNQLNKKVGLPTREQFSREELSNKLLEEFIEEGEEFEESERRLNRTLKIILPLIAIAIGSFVFYAWHNDKIAISKNDGTEAPVVKADTTPLRIKPDDPGGLYIANRDKQVYDTISNSGEGTEPKVINVLPKPEEPLDRTQLNNLEPASAPVAPEVAAQPEPAKAAEQPVAPATNTATTPTEAKAEAKPAELPKTEQVAVTAPLPEPEKEETPPQIAYSENVAVPEVAPAPVAEKPAAKTAEKTTAKPLTVENIKVIKSKETKAATTEKPAEKANDSYKVQLGSFRSEDEVKTTWNKLKRDYAKTLEGTKLYTEKADLGEKGVFFRLQATGIKKEADARKICQELTKNKQGCFVVKK